MRHQDKIKTKRILFVILITAIIAISALFIFSKEKAQAPHNINSTANQAKTASLPAKAAPPEIKPASVSLNKNVDLSKLNIPIIMYHHIRDYNDPKDQVGINLSVSPVKFAGQLDYLKEKGYQTITFLDVESGNIPAKPIILTFDDGYENFYTNAYPELKKRSMSAVSYIITAKTGGDYMTIDQIKTISQNGIEIGDHTEDHPDLSTLSGAKLLKEINESKTILQNEISKDVISFCYPSGKYNDTVLAVVKSSGYKFATTTKSGEANFGLPYELQRYRMNSDTNISGLIR